MDQSSMRSQIKHNFLNQIIYRINYDGVLDSDVDEFVKKSNEIFKQEGFDRLQEGRNSVFDVQIQEGDGDSTSNVSVYPREKGKVFHIQSKDGRIIELSRSAFIILIRPDKTYKKIDKYFDFINNIIRGMKKFYSFPEVTRIGLRKINLLYVFNTDKINQIFTKSAFNVSEISMDMNGVTCKNSNESSLLIKDDFYVNYVRDFQEGELEKKTAYQLALDIDVFQKRNDDIKKIFDDEDYFRSLFIQQNNVLFDIYYNSLNDNFKAKLTKENFNDSDIRGVR